MIDQAKLLAFSRHAAAFHDGLNESAERFQILPGLRQCHWLAQLAHESMDFTRLTENLNYSGERLLAVFPAYFKTMDQVDRYAHHSELIANRVYANRFGNGGEETGDGWRYRGRGLIHLTFRDNYRAAYEGLCVAGVPAVPDFEVLPDAAQSLYWAPLIAGWYWDSRHCNTLADRDDLKAVTKAVNGGLNGYDDRAKWLAKAKATLQ